MTHPCPTLRSADLSPTANQSTPRRSRHASASPPGHAPDCRNGTPATCQSRATPRITTPKADDDFPLPSPVFTTTTLFCLRTGGVWCSVGIPDDAVTGSSLVADGEDDRSEEHTSELQSLMRISYAVFCLKKKKNTIYQKENN